MLYGREAERNRIGDLLAAARTSRSGALLVRGEAGAGKTALLEDARDRAADMHVLAVRGVESESELPFAGLDQLLRPALDLIDLLPSPQAAALRGALGLAESSGEDRFLISAACLTLLAELAERRPILCLVDDVQWVDSESAAALLFAARRLGAEGIAMLLAARLGDGSSFEAPGLEVVELGGLDPGAAAALVEHRAGGELAPSVRTFLVEQAAGNALALVELPAAMSSAQLAGREPLAEPLQIGPRLEAAFVSRLLQLPVEAQSLLLVAAAEDSGELVTILRAARSLDLPAEALQPAERDGLVRVSGGQLVFRHPLVRSAVYSSATSNERRAAHLALADAQNADDEDRRAWHRAAAAIGSDEGIARELEASADRAARRGGHAAAAAALEKAAELSTTDRDRTLRLLAAADSAWLAGRSDRAQALLGEASRSAPGDLEVGVTKLRGRIEVRTGSFTDALPLLLSAARTLVATEPSTALSLLADAEEATLYTGDLELPIEIGRLAAECGRAGPPGADPFPVVVLTGIGFLFAGRFDEAVPLLREAVALASESDDLDKLLHATRAAVAMGDDPTGLELSSRALRLARERSAAGALPRIFERLPFVEITVGRFSSARIHAEEGLELAREMGQERGAHLALLAMLAALQGREEECRTHAAETMQRAVERRAGILAAMSTWALGTLELGLGRPAEAAAVLESALVADTALTHRLIALFLAPDFVEAATRIDRLDDARAVLEGFEAWANAVGQPWALSRVAHCHGLVTTGDEAERHLLDALALSDSAQRPFDRARTELALGEVQRRSRKRREAREHLRSALAAFELLEAAPWEERARTELRATGETARRRDPSTVSQLTPQELQVARFVAEGLSNKEVAAQLFLSPRTIDAHLRNIFAKLNLTSRTQLARLELGGEAPEPAASIPA
jgi:DNA-binding NarL/FixJ family response regulator